MSQRSQLPATLQAWDETNLAGINSHKQLRATHKQKLMGQQNCSVSSVTDEWISIRYAWNALKGSFHPFNNLSISTLNLRSSILTAYLTTATYFDA